MPACLSSFPAYFALAPLTPAVEERLPKRRRVAPPPPPRPRQCQPKIAPERWPEIAVRAALESLRELACAYGVSHETIRAVVRRVRGAQVGEVAD